MYTTQFYTTIFIYCVIALLILFFIFIRTVVYRYNFRQNRFVDEIEDIREAHDFSLLQAHLDMQEYTFQNISREVHDNIGQKLSLAKLLLYAQMEGDADIEEEQIENSVSLVSQSIGTLADISRSMEMEIINNDGLIKALEFEVALLQRSGLYDISLEITGEPIFLDDHAEMVLFRIVQESLQNINKHAKASLVVIRLLYDELYVTLTIDDNGQGMRKETYKKGTGITNIRNRTATLQGTCSIASNNEGTKLIVHVPIKDNVYA